MEPPLPGYYQYFLGVKCLAQGHNTVEVGFEPQPLAPESDAVLRGQSEMILNGIRNPDLMRLCCLTMIL